MENRQGSHSGALSKDHVHMHISYPPQIGISDIVKRLKGRSSRMLLQEFPELRRKYNAVAESFFGSLKKRLIYHRKYETMEQLRKDLFQYIEVYYNRFRKHSFNNYFPLLRSF
jgi:REP element-mobilizing transposase RayT